MLHRYLMMLAIDYFQFFSVASSQNHASLSIEPNDSTVTIRL